MLIALVRFVTLLRHADIDVGVDATVAAARALKVVSLDDRDGVRTALRITLVRHRRDDDRFDLVFALWFDGGWANDPDRRDSVDEPGVSRPSHAALMLDTERRLNEVAYVDNPSERLAATTPDSEPSPGSSSPAVEAETGEPIAPIVNATTSAGEWAPTDTGTETATSAASGGLVLLAEESDAVEDLRRQLATALERRADRDVHTALPVLGAASEARLVNPFDADELGRLNDLVHRLRRQLDGAPAWRRRPDDRGTINLRRTIRRAVVSGGVPARLVRRSPTTDRSRVVLLADTSLSMRPTIRLMLHVAHMLSACAPRVRVLAFVDRCVEVTNVVRHADVALAIGRLLDDPAGGTLDPARSSDYGTALTTMWARYGSLVNTSTTVIVIGDGRSNGRDPNIDAVHLLRERSRALIWLTPEPVGAWGFGHAEMRRYADECDLAVTIRSLDDLDALVASGAIGSLTRDSLRHRRTQSTAQPT